MKKLEVNELMSTSRHICNVITQKCVGKNGLVCEKIDVTSGDITSSRYIIDEFGDYVNYVGWFGILSEEEKYTKWALDQVKLGAHFSQMPCGLFSPSIQGMLLNPKRKTDLRLVRIGVYADTIIGIISLYQLTHDSELLEIAERFFAGIRSFMLFKNGFISVAALPALKIKLPLSSEMISGNLIEEGANLYRLTNRAEWLDFASLLSRPWLRTKTFEKYGLFTRESVGITGALFNYTLDYKRRLFQRFGEQGKTSRMVELAKSNTHLVSGLLSLYKITKDPNIEGALRRWLSAVETKMTDSSGLYYSYWDTRTQTPFLIKLGTNQSMIEFLIDAYLALHDEEYLLRAKNAVDTWLMQKAPLGLIPSFSSPKRNIAELDPQVDLIVNLLKISEITKEAEWLQYASSLLNRILRLYKAQVGFYMAIDLDRGTPTNTLTEVKFLGLLLKPILLLIQLLNGYSVLNDPVAWNLARDR